MSDAKKNDIIVNTEGDRASDWSKFGKGVSTREQVDVAIGNRDAIRREVGRTGRKE